MKLQNKLFIALLITSCSISIHAAEKANEARFDEIAEKGAQIMPFNLDQTVHVFSKKEDGGLQQVVVINQTNTGQIKLIREHLNEIANKFKQGDFSDPSKLHGENMPGLAMLKKARPGELKIIYTELPDGAQIVYSSDDPTLIVAIHQWFDAQLSDHARHAMPNYPHHLMHPK
ncbi:MAG: aspartate carbamoyltransferase [Methylococcales bacterium]|nr:aspartate carbamoyltransferase [Methylococcales bacterium]